MTNTEIFHIFHIISLFNLPFFQTFHSSTWVSSIFSLSFQNFLLYFPNLITIQLGFVPYFSYRFTIQLGFLPYFSPAIWTEYWAMFSSYQKQALTVMISPLCTNCHDITVILLNVALNTINPICYLQRHIPTYLSIYIFYENYRF